MYGHTDAEAREKVVDPVCGMTFRSDKAAVLLHHDGQEIYFCTDACRRRFEQDPARYLEADTHTGS
ncbi:MAG: YHS domain-containing protein [Gemmatimonadota bacterium]